MTVRGDTTEERRLHPMTLAQRVVVATPALVFLLLPVFRSPDGVAFFNLAVAVIYGIAVFPWMIIRYLRFRYRITEREIIIHSGVFTVTRRNIPIERVQNVEVEQQLLPRLTGTARVSIFTAGSQRAEGVLDVVSTREAERVREVIRSFKAIAAAEGPAGQFPPVRGPEADAPPPASATGLDRVSETFDELERQRTAHDSVPNRNVVLPGRATPGALEPEAASDLVYAMDFRRLVLSGVYRFSPLYIALFFTAIQYIEPDPERMFDWLLSGRFENLAEAAAESPWLAAVAGILTAILFGWLSGIAVNINRFFGFMLESDGERLYHRYGLLSRHSGTIPLKKVQSLIVRTNPAMRRFGWYRLEVQTIGADTREQGHKVAVPFGRMDDVMRAVTLIQAGMPRAASEGIELPETFHPVSKLTIRRAFIRYGLAIAVFSGGIGYFWSPALWGFTLLPLALIAAILRYRGLGYFEGPRWLYVRQGVIRRYTWMIPIDRSQVFYTTASLFQRRLGLASVYVDTAGASPLRSAEIEDLPREEAREVLGRAYEVFRAMGPSV